jgi:hypothetical protein
LFIKLISKIDFRSESLTGMEQIQEGMGELDEAIWRDNYSAVFDMASKLSKVSLRDLDLFPPEVWPRYEALLSSIQILVKKPKLFKLNLLFTLTQPQTDENAKALSKLHSKYKTVLRRLLKWKPDWIGLHPDDPDLVVEKLFSCFRTLKELAELNERIQDPVLRS